MSSLKALSCDSYSILKFFRSLFCQSNTNIYQPCLWWLTICQNPQLHLNQILVNYFTLVLHKCLLFTFYHKRLIEQMPSEQYISYRIFEYQKFIHLFWYKCHLNIPLCLTLIPLKPNILKFYQEFCFQGFLFFISLNFILGTCWFWFFWVFFLLCCQELCLYLWFRLIFVLLH